MKDIIQNFHASAAPAMGAILVDRIQDQNFVKQLIQQKRDAGEPCYIVFPHEWINRSEQILSHLGSYSSNTLTKVFARKCQVKEIPIDLAREFCDHYHIQGSNRLGIVSWGLYHGDDLLGVLSLGRHHRQSDDVVLDRLCFHSSFRVPGGASKLFAAAVGWAMEHQVERIISFSDNRWSIGTVYERLNFVLDAELPPDYFYVDEEDMTCYRSKQSQRKQSVDCPDGMTEKQWAEFRGLVQVYDAGKKRWVYPIQLERKPIKSFSSRKHGYYQSNKAGVLYFSSSYELRAAILLDEMTEVRTYTSQVKFVVKGRTRYMDFLVERIDGSFFIVETKPERQVHACKSQIEDNKRLANQRSWGFQLWTESELGFKSEHYLQVWADEYVSKMTGHDYVGLRKDRACNRSKEYYQRSVASNKVEIYCEFCKETHVQLRLTYDKNVEKNGRFICIKENGHIQGSRPKDYRKNPYAAEGKKKCNGPCGEVKNLDQFGLDKSRADGYSSRCKECRANKAKKDYRNES